MTPICFKCGNTFMRHRCLTIDGFIDDIYKCCPDCRPDPNPDRLPQNSYIFMRQDKNIRIQSCYKPNEEEIE